MNTLRVTKTAFLTSKMYDEHPLPCYMGVPTGMNNLVPRVSHLTAPWRAEIVELQIWRIDGTSLYAI